MEEIAPRVKRTDKTKRKTLGGYWANIKRWDTRGKSSKDLKLIVEDMRLAITHQLVRIKKIKYVLEIYKSRDVTKKLLREKEKVAKQRADKLKLSRKVSRREERIEVLDEEMSQLELTIKQQDREIAKLNREIDKKDETISEVRTQKKRGYTKTVKAKLTPEAQRIQKLADKGVDERTLNNLEYLSRTYKFIKERGLTLELLTILTQAEILGEVRSSNMIVKSYKLLNKLVDLGFMTASGSSAGSQKYWFVSPKGKQLIKDYKNSLSYGKSVLTT